MPEKSDKLSKAEVELACAITSIKRRKFVLYMVESGCNATAAAERAGYANPSMEGCRLMKDDSVVQAIKSYGALCTRNAGESRETILDREVNWASSDIGDYYTMAGDVTGTLKDLKDLTKRQRQCIKKLYYNRHGPVLELHDPGRANRHLAEYAGMIAKDDDGLTPDDAASLIAAAMDRMDELDASSEPQPSRD